jgi:hypothetical protein
VSHDHHFDNLDRRFTPAVALLFTGAARVREVGPAPLTLTASEAVTAARTLLSHRLRWPIPGQAMALHA